MRSRGATAAVGRDPDERTPETANGRLWPSDHAGVVIRLAPSVRDRAVADLGGRPWLVLPAGRLPRRRAPSGPFATTRGRAHD